MMTIKGFRELTEAKGDTAVFTFGRFNPPTTGHEKLINAVAKQQKKNAGSKMYVYPSHSQDAKKNPLPHAKKIAYMRKMFPRYKSTIVAAKPRTAIEVAVELHKKGHKALVMVVGSDRVQEFQKLLDTYNGVDGRHGYYGFDNIEVISAGERDPDAEGVEGMSASKMRAAAADGDYNSFSQGLPKGFKDGKAIYRDVRAQMGIREERDMGNMDDMESRRDAYLTGKLWNVGENVIVNGVEGEVVRKGTNYLSYMTEDGKVHKAWLHQIDERDYKKEYKNYQGKPEQIARRSSRNQARRVMGDKTKVGMDVGHKDNNPLNNDPKNLKNEDPTKNRREPRLREEDEVDEKYDSDKFFGGKGTPEQRLQLLKLQNKALKLGMAGTPKQKAIKKEIDALRKKMGMKVSEELDEGKKLPPHLAKFFDKKGNLKPDVAKRMQKGRSKKNWKDVTPKGFGPSEDMDAQPQDSSIKDRPGTQPKKYYKGLDKETKKKRDAHFKSKKGGPAPGDKGAETKPSIHTKKYQQMYGEVLGSNASQQDYIDDFIKSDAPQFNGKSKEKRIAMAVAAYNQRNEDLDEMTSSIPWLNRAAAKIHQITHPRGYEKLVKRYMDGMKDKEHRDHPGAWAADIARDYRGVEGRDFVRYINKLVDKGKLPKELKAEYVEESRVFTFKEFVETINSKEKLNEWGEIEEAAEYQGRKVTLNKPSAGDVKKSKVYVRNEKGNVVKVNFGDPNMTIKKDNPARRKSFRARHNCENPGPKWKARYWSCKAW